MKIRAQFKLKYIAQYLQENHDSTIEYVTDEGFQKKSYHQLYLDVVKTLWNFLDLGIRPGMTAVLLGESTYQWLVTEVACVVGGIKTIAVPEVFTEKQMIRGLEKQIFQCIITENSFLKKIQSFEQQKVTFKQLSESEAKIPDEIPKEFQYLSRFEITVFSTKTDCEIRAFDIYPEATESLIENLIRIFNLTASDRWLICHSVTDYSNLEYILGGLCCGYNLVLTDIANGLLNFSNYKPTAFVSVPTSYYFFYNQFQEHIDSLGEIHRFFLKSWLKWNPFTNYPRLNNLLGKLFCSGLHKILNKKMKFMIINSTPGKSKLKEFYTKAGLPLFECYGQTELGMIAMNHYDSNRQNTAGRIFPGVDLEVRENNIIWARNQHRRMTDYCDDNETMDEQGFLKTGDTGKIDSKGFLSIIGYQGRVGR